jgi:membrane protein DedA with SNARE-associated domain
MQPTVERPEPGAIPSPSDERAPAERGGGLPSCDDLTASPQSDAVAVAEATGAHLVAPMQVSPRRRLTSILGVAAGFLILGGLSAAFLYFPIDWQAIGSWGYLGVFGVVLVATASVALPIPYLLIVARAGSYLDPFLIGLVAGLAGTLGEQAGYLIGIGGSGLLPHGRLYERARHWICTYGFWTIAFFACVPNPFFDAMGLMAGTLRYSWWRFALSCMLGKSIKFLIAALIGIEIAQHGWRGPFGT